MKAISHIELSPVFLPDLRKTVKTGKKALAVSKANAANASAVKRISGVGSEARTFRDTPQLHVGKRKAKVLSIVAARLTSQPPPYAWASVR